MNRSIALLFAVGWWLTAAQAQAQEKYAIHLKNLGPGDSARFEIKENQTFNDTRGIGKDAKVEQTKFARHLLYNETMLDRLAGAKMPTRVKRVYEKALDTGASLNGNYQVRPYEGKTLLIERKRGRYHFRLEGGDVLTDVHELNAEFNYAYSDYWPKEWFAAPGPVALNAPWKVDPKAIAGSQENLGFVRVIKAEGTTTLVKVFKKDGRLYGVIEAVIETEYHIELKDEKGATWYVDNTKNAFKAKFEGCIDGTFAEGRILSVSASSGSSMRSGLNGFGWMNPGIPDTALSTTGIGTFEYTWKELPRK
jgi:hypothetical protein